MSARMAGASPKKAHVWQRDPNEWYQEPIRATAELLEKERFIGDVWDPACGGGNIILALMACGYGAIGTDIVDRGAPCFRGTADFLMCAEALAPNIVCNPPFFRAVGTEAFIRRALALATGKVAMFVDLRFLAGAKRANGIYTEAPPDRVYMVARRPSCPPGAYIAGGGKPEGGTADWCWLVWDRTSPTGVTRLDWLRGTAAVAEIAS